MALKPKQRLIADSPARFKSVFGGRRFGKTWLAMDRLAKFAAKPGSNVAYLALTHGQAEKLIWRKLRKRLLDIHWAYESGFNKKKLEMELRNGSLITLSGVDNVDALRGDGLDFVVLDEFTYMDQYVWTGVLRPMLSDTDGHAMFIGTPNGRNWGYGYYLKGQDPSEPEFDSWQYTTAEGGNVSEKEIESARRELDPLTFEQEYLAGFVNFEGMAYYTFNRDIHVKKLKYQARDDLILCFDFNVSPGVAVIAQEQFLPTKLQGTGIIGEVHIERNSNTPAVCQLIIKDWKNHKGNVICYGDASGAASGTAKVSGSDWDLIRAELSPVFGNRLFIDIPKANTKVRARINAVNSRLKSAVGDIRFMIDPTCKHLIADFESVRLQKGGNDIDKNYDARFTHMTDALGYYVVHKFPVSGPSVIINRVGLYG